MSTKRKILVVDDDIEMGDILADILSFKGYHVQWVASGTEALKAIGQEHFDLVLLDLLLQGMDGIDTLKKILMSKPLTTVVMMSGHGTIAAAVEATRLGAYDWLEKPLEKERVLLTVKNAIDKSVLLAEKEILLSEAKSKYGMIGAGNAMQSVYFLIDKVAPTNSTVLITGDSGTGKELVAQAIYKFSKRNTMPFIQVNCAAMPDTLVESELFGHVKGAFTGAIAEKRGKFHLADKGTLFLDEIGDLSLLAQAKVLRAIELGQVEKVGSEKPDQVDVRLLAATHKNLKKMIDEGAFRDDLYHRINVIEIAIPALKERTADILPLLHHFVEDFCCRNNITKKQISPDAEAVLLAHPWPGNVRELSNFAEKLCILIDGDKITAPHITHLLALPADAASIREIKTYKQAKESFEKNFLLHSLAQNDWNIAKTADLLGMDRSVFYKKMEKHGIKRSQKDDV